MKRLALLIFLSAAAVAPARAQEGYGDYEYTSEWVYGIGKNTRGGLIGHAYLRHARAINKNLLAFGQFEVGNIKHPQELKQTSLLSGRQVIIGKNNYLYSFRLLGGAERILFRKGPKQGVQISIAAAVGPTVGYSWPYYIEYWTNPSGSNLNIAFEPYDRRVHNPGQIAGPGQLFQGTAQGDFYGGLTGKIVFNFEFGLYRSAVSGFDVGLLADAFFQEIVLIETAENRSFFPMAFISLNFGTRR